MRSLLLLLMLAAWPAHADLYRWLDPETGTVKISSLPPADPSIQAEVIRYNAPPPPKPAAPIAGVAPASAAAVPELENRWRSLLSQFTGLSPQDFNKGAEGLQQHVQAYEAVRAELDRQDPAGAARRRAESTSVLDSMRARFAAYFNTTPPATR